jgi:non-specific serine/threonine protein kinase
LLSFQTLPLPSLSPSLQRQLEESKDFVHVLSAPSQLQLLSQSDIPGLRSDIVLRGYQLEGITWLTFLARFHLNGILGDDMGLGKTLQTLALLAIQRKGGGESPSLIVCPRTLATHWCKEWANYFPGEEAMVKFGDGKKNGDGTKPEKLVGTDKIMVCSYEEVRANVKKFK